MATPVTTAAEYCTLLVKSRLLPPEEVSAQYNQWQQEKPGPDDRVDSFRRFLVARKCLTDYQAAIVQRGRADGFFLGGYKILDRIGKGQMGGVYKAVHNFGQVVALKILSASRAKNPQVLGRFQREARLLTQLDHPNVVRAFQVGESGGVHFIAMEHIEGETLADVLERRKRLPWPEVVRLATQTLDGLQHLHERRMVHRDLKPANIMLTPEPTKGKPDTTLEATVKILDVGLGRELFDDSVPESQADAKLTLEGSVLGTPDYLAPEQAKDASTADIRADLYSLGCLVYQCVAGSPPFPESNIMAQMLKHATEKAPPLSTFVPDLPNGFQQVLDKLLAKTPEARYQTPAEAATALKPFTAGGAAPASPNLQPAFKDWLESESQLEAPTLPTARPTKHDSASAPGLPMKPPAPAQRITAKAAPKAGTAPTPALASAPTPPRAMPRAVPTAAPVAVPVPMPLPLGEINVELVGDSGAQMAPGPDRPLWQPDRRDWIMLAVGASGVLSAVGLGYGMARLLRRKPERPESDAGSS
ncbi:protein kinase [Gemmata sp. JC717]|uniref:protein kinase domain-containing protein n=1 Tax=Gemmata algarum TaxID=2975278 RepID=UPI0021BADBD0|nr:serine/threonine-protein kinase [Gemmata algarum]MDY3551277.1 protein kinase [Gemmata algarum]